MAQQKDHQAQKIPGPNFQIHIFFVSIHFDHDLELLYFDIDIFKQSFGRPSHIFFELGYLPNGFFPEGRAFNLAKIKASIRCGEVMFPLQPGNYFFGGKLTGSNQQQ